MPKKKAFDIPCHLSVFDSNGRQVLKQGDRTHSKISPLTEGQYKFIKQVIIPTLVDLAINDKLPQDLTELSPDLFESRAHQYNKEQL